MPVGNSQNLSRRISNRMRNHYARRFLHWVKPILAAAMLLAWLTEPALAEITIRRGETYVDYGEASLQADLYIPEGEGPFPGLLLVHGGGWRAGSRQQMGLIASLAAMRGYTAMTIDYRHAPEHPFPAQIHDCKAAVRWMRQQADDLKLNPNRIGGYGYSAGGHLVALLGTTAPTDGLEGDTEGDGTKNDTISTRLQAVVAGGAPCEFRTLPEDKPWLSYWLGGTRRQQPEAYRTASPAAYVTADDPPMLFFHGGNDQLVPVKSPQLMVSLCEKAGVPAELLVVEGESHGSPKVKQESLEAAEAFLAKYLKAEPFKPGATGE